MFNLFFLKTFVSLAQTNSFRNTARSNALTQSAVSQQIRVLENKLGHTLIERSGKSIHLTQAGETFLLYAENILNQIDEALMQMNTDVNVCSGTIKVATIYSIGLYKLQPLIRTFLKKHPNVNIHLEYYHNDLIYEKISNRTADFGFVAYPKKKEGLKAEIISETDLVLIQSTERPTFTKGTIQSRDLDGCRFVTLSQTTPTGKEFHRQLNKLNIHVNVVHEFENVETLKSAVLIGMGCAIVPKNVIDEELHNKLLRVIKIKNADFSRPFGILSPKDSFMTKAKQKFYDMVIS